MNQPKILFSCISFVFLLLTTCYSSDTIHTHQHLTDGDSIVSRNGNFELGFFNPGGSKNRYLGIWFTHTSPHTVIWVANRESPLVNPPGMVKLNSHGTLSLVDGHGLVIWSPNSSATTLNPVAQLLDTGNLVIRAANIVIWQSFDYPGDTFIAEMKLGKNLETGREIYLTSWRSTDDPSPGEYTLGFSMVYGKYPQIYIKKGSVIESRIGPYDGVKSAGQGNYTRGLNHMYITDMVIKQKEMYYSVYISNSTTFTIMSILTPGGRIENFQLNTRTREWVQSRTMPVDYCDNYGLCGLYGSCSTATFPNCACLSGFEVVSPQEQGSDNGTGGCRRKRDLDCGFGEGFLKFSSMKLPDTQNAVFDGDMGLQECEARCKDECSCTAYANPNATAGGVGCLRWFGGLIDIRVYPENGQDLYVRLAASELLEENAVSRSVFTKSKIILAAVISSSLGVAFLFAVVYACIKKTRHMKGRANQYGLQKKNSNFRKEDLEELPFFSLREIAKATDNFSVANKLGEGGFGPVYKGVLEDQREVAVKRLSETSQQGLDEFKNEVNCIAKLQHRNLVKLLGYYIHRNEMILVYEYMANKSLDTFLFDDSRSSMLDWPRRFHIINGMARGLLYLHQDSRLQIIHRDLKAGNILLDNDMNPKISDFGLARKFTGSDNDAKTKKVVGTYGYISPEYALHGKFSVKSDVFSFGVLVLEIVSGKKNGGFTHEEHSDSLLGHAWRLYKEKRSIELMSWSLRDSCVISEVLRSIHVGLLCVQHHAIDRPTMLSVVLMLVSEGVLPQPKQPAFFTGERYKEVQFGTGSSVDEDTITQLYAR